jgi:hypothetical protein
VIISGAVTTAMMRIVFLRARKRRGARASS